MTEFVDVGHWIQRKLRHSGVTLNWVQIFDCAKVLLTTPPAPLSHTHHVVQGSTALRKRISNYE